MNLANEVAWMKWYEWRFWWKNKRTRDQFRDYVLATQDQLELTSDLIAKIKALLKKWWPLTAGEKDSLGGLLADWLARLDFHKETWQNFLWSNNKDDAEKEYRQLQNAIIWWTLRLGINVSDLKATGKPYKAYYDTTMKTIRDWTGTGKEYNTQWYDKARKRFEKRSWLKSIDSALMTWGISFGLSYLASSLTAHNHTETIDTETDGHIENVWWEYNLWDSQEHLFVSWDVNPTMNSVITPETQKITWASIYSSVDSVPCSVAKWSAELAWANADLTSTFSSSPFATNSDWIAAKTNFINEAKTSIRSIPWVSEWNRQLALARAIEWRNEWILKPAITASTDPSRTISLMQIDPSSIHWADWWIQNATGAVWQSFRNMGLVSIDYIQHGTEEIITNHAARAIAIPVWLNTFWEPKSEVA